MANEPNEQEIAQWRVSGLPWQPFRDVYPRLMGASWMVTIGWAFAVYVGTCVLFAGLYAVEPDGVAGADSTVDLLWFSVQTLSTIGYGGMTPETLYTHVLVIVESFIGLAGVAVVTAILYAKFSLPDARVQFANVAAVHDYEGVPHLHLRMASERTSPILDAELHVGALIDESVDGHRFRRLHDVALLRSRIPMFVMGFTAMHRLDESSPLRALTDPERFEFLLVTMRGTDARTLQPVFTQRLYRLEHVRFGKGFANMVTNDADGVSNIDIRRLDELVPREVTRWTPPSSEA